MNNQGSPNTSDDYLGEEAGPVPVILLPFGTEGIGEECLLLIAEKVILLNTGKQGEKKVDPNRVIRNTIADDIIPEHGRFHPDSISVPIPHYFIFRNRDVSGDDL